jgi:hypothetical protein
MFNQTLSVKAVRFDKLGKKYFLDSDNCIINDSYEKLLCGQKDFEVTVDGKIIALNDGAGTL